MSDVSLFRHQSECYSQNQTWEIELYARKRIYHVYEVQIEKSVLGSLFGITEQALWWQTVTHGRDFLSACHTQDFYASMALAPWGHRAFGLSVHAYVRLLTRLRFLSKVESQDLLMVASRYFIWACISLRPAGIYKSHDIMTYISGCPLTSDFGQIIKVRIFVQDRILTSTNGSKLIFHIRMYLCETIRYIQEPWPHDLYFTVC